MRYMIRSLASLTALASMTACGLTPDGNGADTAPAETTSASAVSAAVDSVNFPDGENCAPALEVRALELFEQWFAANDHVKTAWSVDYSGHYTVGWNSGGSFRMVLRAVLQGEAGGLILQTQTLASGYEIDSNELVFFDATGNQIATVPGVYYFHLDDQTLLVSTAMRDRGEYRDWSMLHEEIAAVSLTGQVRWKTYVGGSPHGVEWASYNPNLPTWNMYHPRLAMNGQGYGSGLFRAHDDKLVWTYFERYAGNLEAGISTVDPANGKKLAPQSALTRDRLCTLTSTVPECAMWAREASVRAEWWVFWDPRWNSWEVTGFVPPTDDHWLMVEVATVRYSAGKREDGRKLLFYPADIEYPYWPYAIVDGMYYFHADADTIVASLAMGSSGWYGSTQTPWYGANERLVGLTSTGAGLWERGLAGEPVHSAVRGTQLSSSSTLTLIEGGALLWSSFWWSNGGGSSLKVLDPLTGRDAPAPSPYGRRTTCTPAGTPLWQTRTTAPNLAFTRTAPAVSTLSLTGPGTIKNLAFSRVFIDRKGARASDVTLSIEHDGITVMQAGPFVFTDVLDAGRVIELGPWVLQAFRGHPIAGDWTLRVANGNMELNWWSMGLERQVPAPTRYSYAATATNHAQVGTVNQSISLAAGQTLAIGTCGVYAASFRGDTYLRLVNSAGAQVAENDDACGMGSRLTYTAQSDETLEVRAGCYASNSCDGAVAWMVY
jgi:hypothetical protein